MSFSHIHPKWWAIAAGVVFGSLALINIEGPKRGYRKSIISAVLSAPFLGMVAGGLMPADSSLEMTGLVAGVIAVGGSAVVLKVMQFAPELIGAGLRAAAESYLRINPTPPGERDEVVRENLDGTPLEPAPELEALVRQFDKKDD